MELGLLFLFGLTITSAAGSALPRARSPPLPAAPQERGERAAAAVPRGRGDGGAPRRRTRRCTCYTYKDKECVYYCHLDIIWINTPDGKTKACTDVYSVGYIGRGYGECFRVCGYVVTAQECGGVCHFSKEEICFCYTCESDIPKWPSTRPLGRTVPYGLSNYRGSFRGKRSTDQIQSTFQSSFRCSCLDAHDKQCLQFCRRTQDRRRNHGSMKKSEEKDQCTEEEHTLIQ